MITSFIVIGYKLNTCDYMIVNIIIYIIANNIIKLLPKHFYNTNLTQRLPPKKLMFGSNDLLYDLQSIDR